MDASLGRRPDVLAFTGNVAENWHRFERDYDVFIGCLPEDTTERRKAMLLLNLAGPEAVHKEQSFVYLPQIPAVPQQGDVPAQPAIPGEDRYSVAVLKRKFSELCTPQRNIIMERHTFNSRRQRPDESFNTFFADLRTLAGSCDYGDLTDQLIRDRIVTGINDNNLRKHLLKEHNLTLQRAVTACQVSEHTDQSMEKLSGANEVNKISVVRPSSATPKQCGNCGKSHARNMCPAFGKQCRACNKMNHFESCCRSKPSQVHVLDEYYIDSLNEKNVGKEIFTTLTINGNPVEVKLDTGAKCNVLPLDTFQLIRRKETIDSSNTATLIAFGGSKIITVGTATMLADQHSIVFHVVDKAVCPILGLEDCMRLDLLKVNHEVHEIGCDDPLLADFKDVFTDGIGKLPVVYKMTVDPTVPPVVHAARRIPPAVKDDVKAELNRMVNMKVITPVSEATDWVSSMVAARKKSGDIRICIDPRDLNRALKRPRHPLHSVEELLSDMANAKFFSVLDVTSGFWTVPLERESSFLTTFATPFGRYRFLRMPFGIATGSEVFQCAMEQVFANQPCKIFVDDILIWGKTAEEHDANLFKVLKRAQELNLKLNRKKCRFCVPEVPYVGHLLTNQGLKPDPSKIQAITEYPAPTGPAALQRFLGMANYLAKFLPNHSQLTASLRALLKDDTEWQWTTMHDKAFNELKATIASPSVLSYFDVHKPVTLTCDASQDGIGAACLQEGRPIAYASRAMTATETRYAQIEKELLAVLFACKRFNDYIFGKSVIVETDHQPLISIMKKPLHMAPIRLQRMMLSLQRYSIELIYKKGKDLHIADALSRAYCTSESSNSRKEDFKEENYDVICLIPLANTAVETLRNATKEDPEMKKLAFYITSGWPRSAKNLPPGAKNFFSCRDELAVEEDIIFRGSRVVVPASLQEYYVAQLHRGHIGTEATKARARETCYWTSMTKDIEDAVSQCTICNSMKPHQQKQPMLSHDTPDLPWSTVASDIFTWNSCNYLVLVDAYSNWFEIDRLRDLHSATIIQKLKRHFATHGAPNKLITDNGRQFVSGEFEKFANEWDFVHCTSSPGYPQANGLAERAVQSAKKLLESSKQGCTDQYMDLLHLRNVPRDGILGSPAQRLLSRRTRTALPISPDLLRPAVKTQVQAQLLHKKGQSKKAYDRNAKPLCPLLPNQAVRLKTDSGFKDKAVVVRSSGDPRSYIVSRNGRTYRRNRRHIRPVTEPPHQTGENGYVPPAQSPIAPSPIVDTPPAPLQAPPMVRTPALMDAPVADAAVPPRSARNKLPSRYQDFVMN